MWLIFQTVTSIIYGSTVPCSTMTYFSKIYSAEINLMEGNNEESMKLYHEAFLFDNDGNIFIKDLHNALMLSYQSGSTHYFKKFISHLHQYDVDSSFFESPGYEEIKESSFHPILRSFFSNKIVSHYNSPVCETFERLYILDQSVRQACQKKYGAPYYYCGKEIALLDSLILDQIKAYFDDHGTPKESYFCDVSRYFIPPYHLLIKHNLNWCRVEVINRLKKELGIIHPQVLADLLHYTYNNPCDGSNSKDPMGLGYHLQIEGDLYILFPPKELISVINQSRGAIYLDRLESFHKKLKFQYRNPEYVFVYPQFIPNIDADKSVIDALREKLKDFRVVK